MPKDADSDEPSEPSEPSEASAEERPKRPPARRLAAAHATSLRIICAACNRTWGSLQPYVGEPPLHTAAASVTHGCRLPYTHGC